MLQTNSGLNRLPPQVGRSHDSVPRRKTGGVRSPHPRIPPQHTLTRVQVAHVPRNAWRRGCLVTQSSSNTTVRTHREAASCSADRSLPSFRSYLSAQNSPTGRREHSQSGRGYGRHMWASAGFAENKLRADERTANGFIKWMKWISTSGQNELLLVLRIKLRHSSSCVCRFMTELKAFHNAASGLKRFVQNENQLLKNK